MKNFNFTLEANKRIYLIEKFYKELKYNKISLNKEDDISLAVFVTKLKEYQKLLILIINSNNEQQSINSSSFLNILNDFDNLNKE
jgi:hypothetical protein